MPTGELIDLGAGIQVLDISGCPRLIAAELAVIGNRRPEERPAPGWYSATWQNEQDYYTSIRERIAAHGLAC